MAPFDRVPADELEQLARALDTAIDEPSAEQQALAVERAHWHEIGRAEPTRRAAELWSHEVDKVRGCGGGLVRSGEEQAGMATAADGAAASAAAPVESSAWVARPARNGAAGGPVLLVTILGFLLDGDARLQAEMIDSALVQLPVIGSQLREKRAVAQGQRRRARGRHPRDALRLPRRRWGHAECVQPAWAVPPLTTTARRPPRRPERWQATPGRAGRHRRARALA